jgi:ribosome-associated heat shock protein Hsp15
MAQDITRTFGETGPSVTRIDRWLYGVRLFKSRSAATEAVAGGRVHLNGERVKPSHAAKPGDAITFARGGVSFERLLLTVPLRRGPAIATAKCYTDCLAVTTGR